MFHSSILYNQERRNRQDIPEDEDEYDAVIELVKAMLQWDEKDRISPSDILNHPFITRTWLDNTTPPSTR